MIDFLKQGLVDTTTLSRDALHIHIGLLIMALGYFAVPGRRVFLPWLIVLAAGLINEAFDLYAWYGWTGGFNWDDSVHDMINTMLWPTALLAYVTYRRRSALGRHKPAPRRGPALSSNQRTPANSSPHTPIPSRHPIRR